MSPTINPNSNYSKFGKAAEPLTAEKISSIGLKKSYPDITSMALIVVLGVSMAAIIWFGVGIGVLALLSIFNCHPPFWPVVSVIMVAGTMATVIWLMKGWGISK
jgi:hypothetical protein